MMVPHTHTQNSKICCHHNTHNGARREGTWQNMLYENRWSDEDLFAELLIANKTLHLGGDQSQEKMWMPWTVGENGSESSYRPNRNSGAHKDKCSDHHVDGEKERQSK